MKTDNLFTLYIVYIDTYMFAHEKGPVCGVCVCVCLGAV